MKTSARTYLLISLVSFGVVYLLLLAYTWGYLARAHPLMVIVKDTLSADATTIVIGDSHTGAAFKTDDGSFLNLSVGSSNVWMWQEMLDRYRQHTPIDRLVMLASPHMFAQYRYNYEAGGFTVLSAQPPIRAWLLNPLSKQAIRTSIPYLKESLGFPNAPSSEPAHWGLFKEGNRNRRVKRRIKMHTPREGFAETRMAKVYVEMIEGLRAGGTEICLVKPPVSQLYETEFDRQCGCAGMGRVSEALAGSARRHLCRLQRFRYGLAGSSVC